MVIAARRGPAASAFTLPELIGLTATHEVVLDAADHELVQPDLATESDPLDPQQARDPGQARRRGGADQPAPHPAGLPADPAAGARRRSASTGIEFTATGTDEVQQLDAGLVLTSIGYRGKPIRDLPFDEAAAVVPNDGGACRRSARCLCRRLDQARSDGIHRHQQVVRGGDGAQPGRRLQRRPAAPIPTARPPALDKLVRGRQPAVVDAAGWKAIDAAEIARGGRTGRATSSPPSPTCSRPPRRHRLHRWVSACSQGSGLELRMLISRSSIAHTGVARLCAKPAHSLADAGV